MVVGPAVREMVSKRNGEVSTNIFSVMHEFSIKNKNKYVQYHFAAKKNCIFS